MTTEEQAGVFRLHRLTQLQPRAAVKGERYRLYVYGSDGFHGGAIWFCANPDGKLDMISIERARSLAKRAISTAMEVRVTDGGDFLLFHSQCGEQLWPAAGTDFWGTLG